MSKTPIYSLNFDTQYLRTSESKSPDREKDKEEGKCNNFNDRQNGGKPIWIMEHHTHSNLQRSLDIFLNGGVSAHYMIDKDGTVYHLIADQHRAYHAGPGYLNPNSKLNPHLTKELMKGNSKDGIFGGGEGDMNSWSIGIENVNSGYEPFTPEQTKANIYLHEQLVTEHKINPKILLSHADWTPKRKCDPSPYYDWQALATAAEKYEDIEHNFGVCSSLELKPEPEVVVSYKNPNNSRESIEHMQNQLAELGYPVLLPEDENLGIYDQQTRDAAFAFTIRYLNKTITGDGAKIALWEQVDTNPELCRGELGQWTENHDQVIGDILHLYSE